MEKYFFKAHAVEVQKIAKLAPLATAGQQLVSPELGLSLLLDDGTAIKWLSESGSPAPHVGDFFVRDNSVHSTYLVPAAAFDELFGTKR